MNKFGIEIYTSTIQIIKNIDSTINSINHNKPHIFSNIEYKYRIINNKITSIYIRISKNE